MDFMNYVVQEKSMSEDQRKIYRTDWKMPSTVEENYTYKNNGDLTFSKMNKDWVLTKRHCQWALMRLDNDGDMDLIVNNIDEKAFIYRNNAEKFTQNNYLKIALQGWQK